MCVIAYKNKMEDFRQFALFSFVWTTCFGRSCRLQKLFCTDTDLTEQSLSNMERHVYEILIVEIEQIHPELQFGTYEVESEHFRWEKEKRNFNEWFQDK